MPKRKTSQQPTAGATAEPERRRSARLQKTEDTGVTQATATATVTAPAATTTTAYAPAKAKKRTSRPIAKEETTPEPPAKKSRSSSKAAAKGSTANGSIHKPGTSDNAAATTNSSGGERNYWLMKAEPESRFENGVDVKFSIDDLAAATEPEPWDGVRAYAARNNLRAMKKGDLAFFYHSNCKEPGIVGTMEIVQEHSPDLTAHDPKAPYYDPTSKPSDPKWSVVHVEFRSKFAVPIGLKELREMGGPGKPLENMQMLKQSRLSVSKVSAAEWEFLMGVAEKKASAK